jgi:hypothetical protein
MRKIGGQKPFYRRARLSALAGVGAFGCWSGFAVAASSLARGRAQRVQARGVGISVAGDDATDCRCHRGQFVVGKVNCRHGLVIIGRHLFNKDRSSRPVGPTSARGSIQPSV